MISRIYPCEFAELPEHLPVIEPRDPYEIPEIGDDDFDEWHSGEWDYDYVPDDDDDYPPEYNEDWDWE